MAHLHRIKDEYQAWVRRLESGSTGLPEPTDPAAWAGWKEILELLCTPEQALLASRLPVLPAGLEEVSRRTGQPPAELRPRLDELCDRGLVMDLVDPRTGATTYFLSPSIIGFVEFSLMRASDQLPARQLARAYDAYMTGDEALAREVFGFETTIGRTLVNESSLAEEQLPDVLDWERATALVRDAPSVSVSLCYCRHKAEHLGKRCAAPIENCLSLGEPSGYLVRRGFARTIERAEGLALLEQARDSGLVQIADNVRDAPSYICNCCRCCCGQLQAVEQYGLFGINPSRFAPALADDRCTGCGRCVTGCPTRALSPADPAPGGRSAPKLDEERCLGCGLCAVRCARKALTMRERTRAPKVPLNTVERLVRMAIERGRLASLIVDEGAGRGWRFLHRVVRAVLALPPARRALANEQLRSRLVAVALSKVGQPGR